MPTSAALTGLCLLAVLSSSGAQETTLQTCDSLLFERLSGDLKVAADCGEAPASQLSAEQAAEMLISMGNLTETLHKHQLKACQDAEPKKCHWAEVPSNGGLTCVTVDQKRYCKPLCNYGYDFDFIRRSRLFDECGAGTGFRWNSQYVGGNKLAVCNEAAVGVSGASTAYFPKDQECLKTKTNPQLMETIITTFTTELKNQGIPGVPHDTCLVCG